MTGAALDPKFTAPNTVNAGDVVTFNGMESDITMNAAARYGEGAKEEKNYAKYAWNFGDGSAEVTGYAPSIPISVGLPKFVEWYHEFYSSSER